MLAVYLDRSDRLLRTIRIRLFAYLDIRRRGSGCGTGSTGGGDVFIGLPSPGTRCRILRIVRGIVQNYVVLVAQVV